MRGEPHFPGKEGWPTIRYFSEDTGRQGGDYIRRTEEDICIELGDHNRMIDYVEAAGQTVLCDVMTGENCIDRELAYIEKFKPKTREEQQSI